MELMAANEMNSAEIRILARVNGSPSRNATTDYPRSRLATDRMTGASRREGNTSQPCAREVDGLHAINKLKKLLRSSNDPFEPSFGTRRFACILAPLLGPEGLKA
ncbi:hypothetical protein HGRIS_011531 [Hohenbuehelia grisea]|uniref:Uncharacterized protein n=1 Tax=Hohenbuehelia grisea TaxID=104357 RepID=A0ABR3JX47_9AGAR